jgi:hypothetical protein
VSQLKFYIDEDAMDSDLAAALRSRGVAVVTAVDAGFARKSDDEQLRRILRLRAITTTVSMRNQVEFLGNWA